MTAWITTPDDLSFEDLEEDRLFRKQRLAAAFRIFALRGFDEGVAGHVTVRDPIHRECFWVNPLGVHFGRIAVSDLLMVSASGDVLRGNGYVNTAAFAIHSQIHQARPDVNAAAHSHSIYGRAWSTLGRRLPATSQDSCAFYEDHALFDDFTGAVLEPEDGKRIADALGAHKAVILRNHGLLTVGESVEEAIWWYMSLERACQMQLLSESAGQPIAIDREAAIGTRNLIGSSAAGWYSSQPLFEKVASDQPDLVT